MKSPTPELLRDRYFILPWVQFGDATGTASELGKRRAETADHLIRVGTERLSIKQDTSSLLPTGFLPRSAPAGIEGLPFVPLVFVPVEERPPLVPDALTIAAATLDVITTVTDRLDGHEDLLSHLVAAAALGGEYNQVDVAELAGLLVDGEALRQAARRVTAIRSAITGEPIPDDAAAPPTVRGGTRLTPRRAASADEQQAATLAAVERLERAAECMVRLLLLDLDQQQRPRAQRI